MIRRLLGLGWDDALPAPTIGLHEAAGRIIVHAVPLASHEQVSKDLPTRHVSAGDLPIEIAAMIPAGGITLDFLEIGGGFGGHLRPVPRGQSIEGILLCYDSGDRASFRHTAHQLMLHSTQRHFAQSEAVPLRLAAVLCGNKIDRAQHAATLEEVADFEQRSKIRFTCLASAFTGEGCDEVLNALLVSLLEMDEEALLQNVLGSKASMNKEAWNLRQPVNNDVSRVVQGMTSPRSLRPFEPKEVCWHHGSQIPPRVVEVYNIQGEALGIKPLLTCVKLGLLHRGIHIWLSDPQTGGLLLRHYSKTSLKLSEKWGPSCSGEVLAYGPGGDGKDLGLRPSETTNEAAARVLHEQLGLKGLAVEFLFSCRSKGDICHELVEVFMVSIRDQYLPGLSLFQNEQVEWIHFLDVFGKVQPIAPKRPLFHIDETYAAIMVQKMRSRILHADAQANRRSGLAEGRLH